MINSSYVFVLISVAMGLLPEGRAQQVDRTAEENPLIDCGKETCSSIGGYCGPQMKCLCYDWYATRAYSTIQCDYEMISKIKAGLIELVFGFGLGQFYALRKANGRFKLFLYLSDIFCFLICVYYIKRIRDEEEPEDHPYVSLFVLFTVLFALALAIWQVIDGFMFLLGYVKDGNGMPMY